jgi:hypothetical protein
VNVRGIAQEEAAAIPEVLGAAVMDPIGREPAASLERKPGSRFLAYRGSHVIEAHILPPAQGWRQDADHPPVIGTAHREEQVESVGP